MLDGTCRSPQNHRQTCLSAGRCREGWPDARCRCANELNPTSAHELHIRDALLRQDKLQQLWSKARCRSATSRRYSLPTRVVDAVV